MSLFSFPASEVLTSVATGIGTRGGVVNVSRERAGGLTLMSESGMEHDLSNQFIIFQFGGNVEGPALVESAGVEPWINGSPDEPDVLVALQMLSFHLAADESVASDTRATLRINFGKDDSSTDRRFDTVFWSIAAGLDLYNQQKKRAESKDYKADLQRAFANRPIEIYGGLGRLSFEVVKHKEPKWWRRIFDFAQTHTGESLISLLGFPAITRRAVAVVDELLERLLDAEPEPLFKSLPMRLALSKYAREEFTGGNPRIRIGALTRGFCIMARGKDFDTIAKANVDFHSTYGKLVPRGISDGDLLAGNYDDPLRAVTYFVFRIGTKPTKLDPTFNFS